MCVQRVFDTSIYFFSFHLQELLFCVNLRWMIFKWVHAFFLVPLCCKVIKFSESLIFFICRNTANVRLYYLQKLNQQVLIWLMLFVVLSSNRIKIPTRPTDIVFKILYKIFYSFLTHKNNTVMPCRSSIILNFYQELNP